MCVISCINGQHFWKFWINWNWPIFYFILFFLNCVSPWVTLALFKATTEHSGAVLRAERKRLDFCQYVLTRIDPLISMLWTSITLPLIFHQFIVSSHLLINSLTTQRRSWQAGVAYVWSLTNVRRLFGTSITRLPVCDVYAAVWANEKCKSGSSQ